MNLRTIEVDNVEQFIGRLYDAAMTGRMQVTDSIAINFKGKIEPIVEVGRNTGNVDIRWPDPVEIDLPGFIDPDVDYIRLIGRDRLEVRFKVGGKVTIKQKSEMAMGSNEAISDVDKVRAALDKETSNIQRAFSPNGMKILTKRRTVRRHYIKLAGEALGISKAVPSFVIWWMLSTAVRYLIESYIKRLFEGSDSAR